MTYPPQQPGPYGPQPDPYGQQQPQQPGWTGGFPQQQQPGPYGQQPYGQQQQPYGYGGYPGGMPPQKSNKGLIIGLAVAGVLLVGGGVTTVLLLTGDDDKPEAGPGPQTQTSEPGGSGSPDAVVQQVIKAIDDKSAEAARATLCDPNSKSPAFELDEAPATLSLKASLSGEITETGSTARARLSIKATQTGKTGQQTIPMTLSLRKDGGKWCVGTATMGSTGGSSSSTPRTTTTRPTF